MWKAILLKVLHNLSLWAFWPGVALIAWGELTPHPPSLGGMLAWDKADHFIAYFGLASMATMAQGPGRRLAWSLLALILLGGALEILQAYTGRDPEILDFVANSLGTFSGAAVGGLFLFLLRDRALVAESRGE